MSSDQLPTLTLIGGLPAAGKTTLGKRLELDTGAIYLCPDAAMAAEGMNLKDVGQRKLVENRLITQTTELLMQSCDVILELGLWKRSDRDELRSLARNIPAHVQLRFLDPSLEVLRARLELRNAVSHHNSEVGFVTPDELMAWFHEVQAPTDDELRLFDVPELAQRPLY